jgi:hypothetical protein
VLALSIIMAALRDQEQLSLLRIADESERDPMAELEAVAEIDFDGHVTIMKFTTNWRVGFGTAERRCDIDRMWPGKTFAEAATAAIDAHNYGKTTGTNE